MPILTKPLVNDVLRSMTGRSSGGGGGVVSTERLMFDRRYGWVLGEQKEPTEEALSGGRGMFCIVPLTRTLIVEALESVGLESKDKLEETTKNRKTLSSIVMDLKATGSYFWQHVKKMPDSFQSPGPS